jgi:ElaB/YqjD/DUF883 family membrane-anchored ribosome-binding protein
MSIVGLVLNLVLVGLLVAALFVGLRLNKRLKALRDSHDGFASAVRELNSAAQRAEQGLADLRAATDEAVDLLADRIEKGRALATRLERAVDQAPTPIREAPAREVETVATVERRFGALLAAAREARPAERRRRRAASRRFCSPDPSPTTTSSMTTNRCS